MFVRQAIYRHTAIPVIEKSLDAGVLRDKAMANNLANVNTPKYQRIEVKFEDELREALDNRKLKGTRTDPKHLPVGRKELTEVFPRGYRAKDPANPGEVNNVDIDIEMAKLAENQVLFNYAVKFMQSQTGTITACIKGTSQG